jgi:hypothetical protein
MHPAVARNLSLDTVPCPDPYVERLLDGVAFLAARTRLKVDAERSRFSRSVLDVLYPDLVTPAPATAMVVLKPGPAGADDAVAGHVVKRNTRLVSSLQPGLSTRCTFTTAQDITLWPIAIHFGELFSGSQRAGGGRHRTDRRHRRRGGAAPRADADRKRQTRRTGARPARPLFCRAHQGAAAVRRHFRRLRGHWRTTRKARPTGCRPCRHPKWSASATTRP